MRLAVFHQWEGLASPFVFSLLLSLSHPPLSPLCIAGGNILLLKLQSALWWTSVDTNRLSRMFVLFA